MTAYDENIDDDIDGVALDAWTILATAAYPMNLDSGQ